MSTEDIDQLTEYGRELVAAGFEVWLTKTHSREGGYLQYRNPENGCSGSLQYSYYDGWAHFMPLVPSREFGSSMHMQDPADPFTVEAAQQCAQPFNYNDVIGRQANARDCQWRSPDATQLHS